MIQYNVCDKGAKIESFSKFYLLSEKGRKYDKNSSGDEIANLNFLYIIHALQNTVDLCINFATYRRGYVSEHRFTKFSEITQCNGHYAVQGH